MKRWIIKNKITDGITVHSNKLINNLLLSRGIKESSEVHKFLKADLEGLHNPFLLKDMDRAVERIDDAIRKREKIVIYGDYDVDGITSTSILYRAFKKLGIDVSYYIPDRMSEGYGINKEAIEYIKSLATDLIITVDCGISAIEEVEYAKSLGMDIIITDHHECKENIPDTIVINPKRSDCSYPFKNLAGCGVAFKLVQALWMKYNLTGFEELLDIAAIGTIADIVDLRGENRIITKNGLKKIITSEKCGIRALKTISGIGDNVSSYSVAFQIAPRINAIGRLRDAKIAVELFITNDYDKAMQIAKYLDQENKNRQKIEEEILNEALIKIENEVNMKEDRVIVLSSPNWHIGVVGIVASRIVERFNRPVILICEEGENGRGSGRSIEGFNLFDNLCECKDILLKFGGHELAAGLSIEVSKISELRQRLNELAKKVDSECFLSKLSIDMEVNPEDVSLEAAETLKMFEPFGCGNPAPLFYMEQLSVLMKRGIGNKEQHLKLLLEKDGYRYDGISFNGSKDYLDKDWDYVDVAFNMDVNEWNNNKNVQLLIKDIRPYVNWIKESLYNSYYRYLKFIVNDKQDSFDFEGVNFIKKDINFLKDFVCFNRGYVLVSSYDSLREIEFLLNYVEINGTTNLGTDSQVIICPDIECIDFVNNEVIIYDFLLGEYEYKKLREKVKSNVYNFYDEKLFNKIDKFSHDISLDPNSLFKLINDCIYNEIIGTVNEIGLKYGINPYKAYKSVLFLKDNGFIDIFVNKETLKIKAKDGLNADGITINLQDKSRDKINNLKLKLKSFIREE